MKAAIPENEAERLSALYQLDILDTEPEEVFDRITRLAAQIIGTPIALVSLVDRDRQWFKSKIGLDLVDSPRDIAFCSHAVLDDDILLVPNATEDTRFANNPFVTPEDGIKFYAGAPLILKDGIRLGTLCTIDSQPRELTEEQKVALSDLASVVVDELALRQSLKALDQINLDLNKQSILELQRANKALKQFAYMASHDLRSPLKQLVTLADIALLDSDGALAELVQPMRDSAARLEELVNGYRRLAELEHGLAEPREISELVEKAREQIGDDVVIDLREDATLTCDPVLITQVLVNLFENARKYGDDAKVVIDAREIDGGVAMTVRNSVENTFKVDQTVFAPFRRLVTEGGGDGLGLAIVERIVHLHDGSVSASCSDNTFTVELLLANQVEQ